MLDGIVINNVSAVKECITCNIQKQMLQSQYAFNMRVGMGVLFAGVGILGLCLYFAFKDVAKSRKPKKAPVEVKKEEKPEESEGE